jgi:predicted ATP-grasp superfamily ATP-dependent carboligase
LELQAEATALGSAGYPLLVQQRVEGPGIGVFMLRWKGEVIAAFAHRRIREKPPSGGVSVYRESAPLDPELFDKSRRLLESFDWSGVAMIEYKVDAGTGVPYLMEINGRFWGSLQLAVDAGVDFPVLLLDAATGASKAPMLTWKLGIQSRWWWGDVDQLLARLTRSRRALNLPPGAPSRLQALVSFLRLWRPGDRNEILRWDDPRPFFRETANWFSRD